MGLAPVVSICLGGLFRPDRYAWSVWLFFGIASASAALSIALGPQGVGSANFAVLAVIFALFSVAVLCSQTPAAVARAIARALYYAFGLALVIGWAEALSGLRLRALLYPADPGRQLFEGRFTVTAWFSNYNDLGVVLAMFATLVLLRFLLDRGNLAVQAARAGAYLAASALVVLAGSRGALLGLLAGSAIACVQAVRVKRPRLIGGFATLSSILAAGLVATVVWNGSWVQDNSTRVRGVIVRNTLAITPDESYRFWLGWGDLKPFQDAAKRAFPGVLMDPHNVVLEMLTWYGLPTLVAFGVLWFVVARRGLWRLETPTDWASVGLVVLFSLTPLLGIVPSSSLRYYYLFLIAPCAVAVLTPRRAEPSAISHG